MFYEHHPESVFPHRVVFRIGDDDAIVLDILEGAPNLGVHQWLWQNIGRGGRNAAQHASWHIYSPKRKGDTLFSLGPFWLAFRDQSDAVLFQITWKGQGKPRE